MKDNILKTLRRFIREEIGRNFHTIDTTPFTFEDTEGYDIQIDGTDERGFFLTIFYNQKKLSYSSQYSTHEDAHHAARMFIEKDKMRRFNNQP